jgi:hypothetical protein
MGLAKQLDSDGLFARRRGYTLRDETRLPLLERQKREREKERRPPYLSFPHVVRTFLRRSFAPPSHLPPSLPPSQLPQSQPRHFPLGGKCGSPWGGGGNNRGGPGGNRCTFVDLIGERRSAALLLYVTDLSIVIGTPLCPCAPRLPAR